MMNGKLNSIALALSLLFFLVSGCNDDEDNPTPNSNQPTVINLEYSNEGEGLNTNPLKGFVKFQKVANQFPHSMEFFYIPLRDIMTAENTFNWATLDAHLNAIAARGHQAVFRVYVDYPKRVTGLPQYLIDASLDTWLYSENGNTAPGVTSSVCPDYNDARLIKAFTDFITALGDRYDGDPRIGFITAGLYGYWGEWHIHDQNRTDYTAKYLMTQVNKDLLLTTFCQAFKKTYILLRYATASKNQSLLTSFGYHDDSFAFNTLGPENHHFWIKMTNAGITEQWKTHPIGGEIRPDIQNTVWDTWPNSVGQDMTTSIQTTHASWMMNDFVFENSLSSTQRANAIRALQMLGYEFYLSEVSFETQSDGKLQLKITINNKGVAPFYYDWPIQLAYTDNAGEILGTPINTSWSLKLLTAGGTNTYETVIDAPPSGNYKVLMRVQNPLPNGNPLCFANKKQDATIPGWLTLIEQ